MPGIEWLDVTHQFFVVLVVGGMLNASITGNFDPSLEPKTRKKKTIRMPSMVVNL